MSKTAKKSFLATVSKHKWQRLIIEKKSEQCYPVLESWSSHSKKVSKNGQVKFLFIGTFYMKGGMELVEVFKELKHIYPQISLSIITAIRAIKEEDQKKIRKVEGINLIEANLSEDEIKKNYSDCDIFVLPTYRDSSPNVLLEALSMGMVIIANDQLATSELVINGVNGYLFDSHPLKDYDPITFEARGKYYNPKKFYEDLFNYKTQGRLDPVKVFLKESMESLVRDTKLIEVMSQRSLDLYNQSFNYKKMSQKIEKIFIESINENK